MAQEQVFTELVEKLEPFFRDIRQRQSRLDILFLASTHPDIDLNGAPLEFTRRLVLALWRYGTLANQETALMTLAKQLGAELGVDQQAHLEHLCQQLLELPIPAHYHENLVTSKSAERSWNISVILGLVLTFLGTIAALLALLPENQRTEVLYRVGIVPASPTATHSPTPSLTPTLSPTPSMTPSPTASPSPSPTPNLAAYDLGIAVAFFSLPQDASISAQEADRLIVQMYTRVASELNAFSEAQTLDLSIAVLAPETVGRIQGTTAQEREASASEIARRYGADMVLYGFMERDAFNRILITPEFYVLPERFMDALEMTGAFRLGKAIEVDGSLLSLQNALQVNRPLTARTTAASQIFIGLIYLALEDYQQALNLFDSAAQLPDWQETEGREVLYLLAGNMKSRLASLAVQAGDFEAGNTQLAAARQDYQAAQALAPDYSRPYTGLAALSYLAWNIQAQQQQLSQLSLLQEALDYLDQAALALERPNDIGIQTREIYARAQVNFFLWLNNPEAESASSWHEDFERSSAQVIRRYGQGENPSVQELASEAYALLGLEAQVQANYDEAILNFEQAIRLSISIRRQMFFYGWMGDAYQALTQTDQAHQAYNDALAIARELQANAQIQTFESKLGISVGRG